MTEPIAVPYPEDMTMREVLFFEETTGMSMIQIMRGFQADGDIPTRAILGWMLISRQRKLPATTWDEIVDGYGTVMKFDIDSTSLVNFGPMFDPKELSSDKESEAT